MTLKRGYGLGLMTASLLALLSVLAGGELPAVVWLTLLAPPIAAALWSRDVAAPAWLGGLLSLASLGYGIALVVMLGIDALLVGAATALAGIFAARLVTRATLTHDLQALLLSVLMVLSGAGLNPSLGYGATFVAYAAALVWALVTRELVGGAQREAARPGGGKLEVTLARRDIVTPGLVAATSLVTLVILACTLVLFLTFPRVGIGRFGLGLRRELPEDVSLRGEPMARASGSVVARVTRLSYEEFARGLYLRAFVFSEAASAGYTRASSEPPAREKSFVPAGAPERVSYEIYMQPVARNRLLALGPVDRVQVLAGGSMNPSLRTYVQRVDPTGEVHLAAAPDGPVRYSVRGRLALQAWPQPLPTAPSPAAPLEEPHAAMTKLPVDLDPRIRTLARDLTRDSTTAPAKAAALRAFLNREFAYTLELPTSDAPDPLATFLFQERRGHCEYFATAFATLLRASGVPSRVVGGFAGGAWEESEDVVVFTAADAHAWVEWYWPGSGWVTDDATPAATRARATLRGFGAYLERLRRAWDDYVVAFGLAEQFQMASAAAELWRRFAIAPADLGVSKRAVALGVLGLVALALAGQALARRRTRGTEVNALAAALEQALRHLSCAPAPSETLRQATLRLSDSLGNSPELAAALDAALHHYETTRFGGQRPDPERARDHIATLETRVRGHLGKKRDARPQ